jgi:membrane protein DedA with SNARE-associated domain
MAMLGAIVDVNSLIETAGYPLVFLLVTAESAGVPVPGETALIAGAVFASQGRLSLPAVIATAAAAAIVGDNLGYLIGRRGGRWLLLREGPFHRQRTEVLAIGEPFFERHGPKAVFFGRFLLGLRTWASWLAGATQMPWRSFLLWNALGGICWATGVGVVAYFVGRSAENALSAFGVFGLVAVVVAAVGLFIAHRRHRRSLRAAASLQEPERGGTGADAQTGTHAQTRTRAETGAQGLTVGPVTEREHTGTRAQTGAQQEGPQQGAMRSHSSASELSS